MGRTGEGFQGTRQTCRAKRCEAATKLQTKIAASFKPSPPRAASRHFHPPRDRPQPAPVSSPAVWAGAGSPPELLAADSTFQHAWASRQPCCTAAPHTSARRGGGSMSQPVLATAFTLRFEAVPQLPLAHSGAQPFAG